MSHRLLMLLLCGLATFGCGRSEKENDAPPPGVNSMAMPGGMQHGDHNPAHGGIVWMQSDELHFEVVLSPEGAHAVYFSDAMRMELPAAVASDVTLTVKRPGGEPEEAVPLTIDEYGESWQGTGAAVAENLDTMASVRFVYEGEPYELEFPFFIKPEEAMRMQAPHQPPPPPSEEPESEPQTQE